LVYIASAFYSPVLYAIRPGGQGDVTRSHIAWSYQRGVPLTPSPLLAGDQIYFVSDNGIATCLDAETGRELWRARLEGEYSASPVLAAGRIYFQNETGTATVIQPGTSFRKLAENEINGATLASMAVVGKTILLRSDTHLYRIEEE
jgi:outer membrane protein assembly factor BamB